MEIEKKFLIRELPEHLEQYPCSRIEQGYLSKDPVIRIRRLDDMYVLTYKNRVDARKRDPVCVNQEIELPLIRESYEHLKSKIDGCIIEKNRFRIPYQSFTIELDVFHGAYEGMTLAEVEFSTEEEADHFVAPDWFDQNVSGDYHYRNVYLACKNQYPFQK